MIIDLFTIVGTLALTAVVVTAFWLQRRCRRRVLESR